METESAAYALGVDAGNTKTIALVARLDGAIIGAGRGGCGDIYDATKVYRAASAAEAADAALAAVEAAVRAALAMAGVGADALVAGDFNMAEPIGLRISTSCARPWRGFGRRVIIVHDSIGVLRAGSPDGTGVAVVCGTGAAIGARAPDGRVWHTSHWQGQRDSPPL